MYITSDEIASLVTSRICHDLASPLGAIANGMELLELSGLTPSPETALIQDSIDAANARVAFFRIAYGQPENDSTLSAGIAKKLLRDNFQDRKLKIQWNITDEVKKNTAKLLFLLVQCAETALPYGADIQISNAGDNVIKIECATKSVRFNKPLWACLETGKSDESLSSAQVQFALAYKQAELNGQIVVVTSTEQTLTIQI